MGLIEVEGMIKFVVHTAIVEDGFDGVTTLQNSFFMHFILGDKEHIHQYDLSHIVMSLIIFPNYGRNQRTDFICMLPKRLQGKFFSDFINNSWL